MGDSSSDTIGAVAVKWVSAEGGAWHMRHHELEVTACYMPLPSEIARTADELPATDRENWRETVCWACARVARIHTG